MLIPKRTRGRAVRAQLLLGCGLLVACGSSRVPPPLVPPGASALAIAHAGETWTSLNGAEVARETYEDDGDTLVSHVEARGKRATIRLSRSQHTVRIEQNGEQVVRPVPIGAVVVEDFCWQELAVAADVYRGATTAAPLQVFVPSRDVTGDATIQIDTSPSGERYVTLVVGELIISANITKDGAVERVRVPAQKLDAQGRATTAPAMVEAQRPAAAANLMLVEEAFSIERPNATVRGTLDLPTKAVGKLPIVLLIAGSGPTDRNFNSVGGLKTDAYKQLAAALAKNGIATLRYDKRGVGESSFTGDVSKIVLGDFVEDARAIVLKLQADPRFSSVSVFGHSEGGLIGLELTQSTTVDALLLAATPGRSMGAILRDQLGRQLDAAALHAFDGALNEVRAGSEPKDVPPSIAPLFDEKVLAFLRSAIDVDPLTLATTSKAKRIAVIQGDMDQQVSVDDDARKLMAAAPRAHFSLIPGMAHTLKTESARKGRQPSYGDPSIPLSALLVDAVVSFTQSAER